MSQSSDGSKNVKSAGRCVNHLGGAVSDGSKTELEHLWLTLIMILFLREKLGSYIFGYKIAQSISYSFTSLCWIHMSVQSEAGFNAKQVFKPARMVSMFNEDLGCLEENSKSYTFPGWFSLP